MLLLYCSEFIIMFQVTTTTITATVTSVCSSTLTTTAGVIMAPTFMKLTAALHQHNVGLLPALMPRDTIRGVALTTVPMQQPQSQMPPQADAIYTMGSQVIFLFGVEPPTDFLMSLISGSMCLLCPLVGAKPST